jgi:hypothetical protein
MVDDCLSSGYEGSGDEWGGGAEVAGAGAGAVGARDGTAHIEGREASTTLNSASFTTVLTHPNAADQR